jgi:arylsulfatase
VLIVPGIASAQSPSSLTGKKPNIIIWGDDIGQSNISAYSHGLMGYRTPNIDVEGDGFNFTASLKF